jgi:hypothetical protein
MNGLARRRSSCSGRNREESGGTASPARWTQGVIIIAGTPHRPEPVRIGELEEELRQLYVPVALPAPSIEALKDIIRQCETAMPPGGQ